MALRGRRLVAAGTPDRRAMDVAPGRGGGLRRSGFVIAGAAGAAGPARPGDGLRVFAVAGDRASRLPVRAVRSAPAAGPDLPPRPTPGAVRGVVDNLVAWGPALALQGWAADTVHRRLPDCILAFAGRRLIAAGPPTVPRRDIAVIYSAAVEHAGFRFGVPMSPQRAQRLAIPGRVRVFAVLGRRASELPVATPR